MQRSIAMKGLQSKGIIANQMGNYQFIPSSYDVFINHRGKDTKKTIASLLYNHLLRSRIRPFLDNKSMKPGDKLLDTINSAIWGCKTGVTVFSPRYCESYFCLHELAMLVESKKKIIPIFCDIKPSELRVVANARIVCPDEIERFNLALEEAKNTVGIVLNSNKESWSNVVREAADIVVESLMEIEDGEPMLNHDINDYSN